MIIEVVEQLDETCTGDTPPCEAMPGKPGDPDYSDTPCGHPSVVRVKVIFTCCDKNDAHVFLCGECFFGLCNKSAWCCDCVSLLTTFQVS